MLKFSVFQNFFETKTSGTDFLSRNSGGKKFNFRSRSRNRERENHDVYSVHSKTQFLFIFKLIKNVYQLKHWNCIWLCCVIIFNFKITCRQLMDLKYILYCYFSIERCHIKIKEKILLYLWPDISTLYLIRYWCLNGSCNKMLRLKIVFK